MIFLKLIFERGFMVCTETCAFGLGCLIYMMLHVYVLVMSLSCYLFYSLMHTWHGLNVKYPGPPRNGQDHYRLGQCQYNVTGWDRSHGLPAVSCVGQHLKLSDISFWTGLWYNLVINEDVEKPTKQTKRWTRCFISNYSVLNSEMRLFVF